jgi:hypothetical protein
VDASLQPATELATATARMAPRPGVAARSILASSARELAVLDD